MGLPEGLNRQPHSEQPKPRKRSCSIHTSSRFPTYRRKAKARVVMFRSIFIFFSLTCSMIQCIPVSLHMNPRNVLFSIRCKEDPAPEGAGSVVYLWGAARINRRKLGETGGKLWTDGTFPSFNYYPTEVRPDCLESVEGLLGRPPLVGESIYGEEPRGRRSVVPTLRLRSGQAPSQKHAKDGAAIVVVAPGENQELGHPPALACLSSLRDLVPFRGD